MDLCTKTVELNANNLVKSKQTMNSKKKTKQKHVQIRYIWNKWMCKWIIEWVSFFMYHFLKWVFSVMRVPYILTLQNSFFVMWWCLLLLNCFLQAKSIYENRLHNWFCCYCCYKKIFQATRHKSNYREFQVCGELNKSIHTYIKKWCARKTYVNTVRPQKMHVCSYTWT